MDLKMLEMRAACQPPPAITEAEIGLDSIREVGPRGHFFGTAHTQERYRNAFWAPRLSDWSNFETWEERGSLDAAQRASKMWRGMVAEHVSPPLDIARKEALEDYVARRKRQILPGRAA